MRKIIFVVLICMLLFSCNKECEKKSANPELSKTIQLSYNIRLSESGFDPNEIIANSEDSLTLYITNTNEDQMFMIQGYSVEVQLKEKSTIVVSLKLDKKGVFEFGDLRESEQRGILIVN